MGNYYKAFDQTYSQLRIYVEMERQSSYYLNRLVTNVGLLVFMAFFASTLRPDVPERTIAVMTVFLCIVTWEFVIIGAFPSSFDPQWHPFNQPLLRLCFSLVCRG
jgi:hypothetical protein